MDTRIRCLFCETGKERQVAETVRLKGLGEAIFAQSVKIVRRQQEWKETCVPLMPGYVFVYSSAGEEQAGGYGRIEHVIRVLRYNDGSELLTGKDLEFAEWIYRIGGKVGVMKAVQEGDRVEIVDGVFRTLRGKVVRMNRRRRKMCVEIEMQGTPLQIWLSYELAEKKEEGT